MGGALSTLNQCSSSCSWSVPHPSVLFVGFLEVYSEHSFILEKQGSTLGGIELLPGAQLRLYLMDDADIESPLNMNTGDPSVCTIYKVGTGTMRADSKDAKVVARILAPEGNLVVRNTAEVFGTYVGNLIDLDNSAQFHVDVATSGMPNIPPDVAGSTGAGSLAGVSSAGSFRSWFRDEPGANISIEKRVGDRPHTAASRL